MKHILLNRFTRGSFSPEAGDPVKGGKFRFERDKFSLGCRPGLPAEFFPAGNPGRSGSFMLANWVALDEVACGERLTREKRFSGSRIHCMACSTTVASIGVRSEAIISGGNSVSSMACNGRGRGWLAKRSSCTQCSSKASIVLARQF